MPSLYSANLKIELMTTGDKSGVWGSITNSNLGSTSSASSGIEQAIVGKATLLTTDFTTNVATFTLIDDPAYQVARAFYLQVDATLSAAGTINVPSIQKPYLVYNNSNYPVTIKVTGLGGGVSVPIGKKTWVYTDGANSVLSAVDYLPSLALGSAMLTTSGGTGQNSYTAGDLTYYASGTALTKLPIGANTYVLASTGSAPQWVAPSTIPVGTATNLAGGTAGATPYQTGPGATTFLPLGTTNYVLTAGATAPQYVAQSTLTAGAATNLSGGAANRVPYQSGTNVTAFLPAPVTAGNAIIWDGLNITWGSGPAATTASNLAGGGNYTVVYQSSAGNTAYLTNGSTGQVLLANTGAAPTWGTSPSSTNLAGGGANTVVYQSASGTTAYLTNGTTGQFLAANTSGAPTWGTPMAGALIFISSQTISTAVASVDFTSGIDSTYDNYQIVFSNFVVASGGRLGLRLRQATTFKSADYVNLNLNVQTGSVIASGFSTTDTFIMANNGGTPDSNSYWSGYFTLSSANNATRRVPAVNGYVGCVGNTAASSTIQSFSGAQDVAGVITGFQLLSRSGSNLTSGTVALYGMAKS